MLEETIDFDEKAIEDAKKPMIFCVTPNFKKKLFMLGEDYNGNEDLEEQGCYPDCDPCGPCSPCRPYEWDLEECYPECNPCSPCNPCEPLQWDREDCYPDCNPCGPCSPCKPDER